MLIGRSFYSPLQEMRGILLTTCFPSTMTTFYVGAGFSETASVMIAQGMNVSESQLSETVRLRRNEILEFFLHRKSGRQSSTLCTRVHTKMSHGCFVETETAALLHLN